MPDLYPCLLRTNTTISSFYQILLLLGDTYEIPYPKLYTAFLQAFNVFTLSFSFALSFLKLECVRKAGYYEIVCIQSSILFALELLGVYAAFKAHDLKARARFFRKLQAYCLITAYFFYSPTTAAIFQVFVSEIVASLPYMNRTPYSRLPLTDFATHTSELPHDRWGHVFAEGSVD